MIPERLRAALRILPIVTYVRARDASETIEAIKGTQGPHLRYSDSIAALQNERDEWRVRYAVIGVKSPEDIDWGSVQQVLERRLKDARYCFGVIFVGEAPATEMVPPNMQHEVIPVDLTEPERSGMDERVRANPMPIEGIEDQFRFMFRHIGGGPLTALPGLDPLLGLTAIEVFAALATAVIANKDEQFPLSPERYIVPSIIDAVRHRWGRVA